MALAPQDPDRPIAEPLDHESRVAENDHEALRLWLRLLTCSNLITNRLRSGLRNDFGCTLPRFDLLAQLERHPEGLKMGELSRRLMVTGGNVTGLTDQLAKEGWVSRVEDPQDRRAFRVQLTETGRQQFRDMAKAHEAWVVTMFSGISPSERQQLFGLLGKLKSAVGDTTDQR